MKRRIVLVNLLILGVIFLAVWRHISAWKDFKQAHTLQRIVNRAQREEATVSQLGVEPIKGARPFSDFMVVFEKNLFRENRRPEEESVETPTEAAEEPPEPPKWVARPMVHGVSAVRGKKQALLTAFEDEKGNGLLRTVKVGDLVQGYTVAEIGDTMLKLRWNDREEVIDMADASQSVVGKGAKAAVTVITVGSAPQAVKTTAAAAPSQEARGLQVVGGAQQGQANQGRANQRERVQGNRPNSSSRATTAAGGRQSRLSAAAARKGQR